MPKTQFNAPHRLISTRYRALLFVVLHIVAVTVFAKGYTIYGVSGEMLKNIKLRVNMVSQQKNINPHKRLRLLKENIIEATRPFGYYTPKISISGQHIVISKGRPVIINHIQLTIDGPGRSIYKRQKRKLPLEIGRVLNTKKYEKTKEILFFIAERKGYLKAKMVISKVLVDLKQYKANIIIHFNTGKRFYFGDVYFKNNPYSDSFLKGYVDFNRNTPYSPKKIALLNDHLSSTDYFKNVIVTPLIGENRHVPIDVFLSPKPSQNYTVGAGYGTDTGIRGRLGWKLLHITDSGHTFSAMIQGSQKQNYLQAQYLIPGPNPITQQFSLSASIFDLDYPIGNANANQLTAAFIHHRKNQQYTLGLNALYEANTYLGGTKQDTYALYPHLQLLFKKIADPLFSKKGYKVSVKLLAAKRHLGAKQTLAQTSGTANAAIWFNPTKTRFYFRSEASYTATKNIYRFPLVLQQLAGGAQSIRGYNFQSIGPGKIKLVGSAEVQQMFKKDWFATAFYDIGDVYNPAPKDYKRGVGVGLMWASPVGALRLGIARALDLKKQPYKVYFSMGPDL